MKRKINIPNSTNHRFGYTITKKKQWTKDELMKEIELISLKSSNLSLSNRKWIVEQVRALIRDNKLTDEEIVKLESL
jgi:hypothetical protein